MVRVTPGILPAIKMVAPNSPLIRVMAEGPDQTELQSLCQEIADVIAHEQGLAE